ncbi:PhnD/SsuA/transferrin family substrate-binding protein [Phenylobacterium sp.]|uniref:PhnD/SsuA/transferrin family substrate-binding protein n=1 Tax=Phenylobacterium sp. TaxID=1871053 RepID=UPI00286CB125|nr:PhnD/SsuA/transferrin family substrate-binding protein [Phenylobacterium sp.]
MKRSLVAGLAAALLTATGAAAAEPLRIAAISPKAGPCAALGAASPAGEKAYYDHLAKRLGTVVQRCPVASAAEAATALAAGKLDLAVLDRAAFAPVSGTARAILTLRPQGGLNRIVIVLAVPATSPARSLVDLRGKTLVLGGATPAALAVPRQAMADRGATTGFFGQERVEADGEAAAAVLRAGQAQAMALHAAAWQRLCPKVAVKKAKPCTDLRVLARIRPQASQAIVVRQDMPLDTRYRLIGIHMPLHLENATAFAWASAWSPKAAEFEPTEAQALVATP